MKYQDFAVTFHHLAGDSYRVEVNCCQGDFSGTFDVPPGFLAPPNVGGSREVETPPAEPYRRIRLLETLPARDPKELGRALFRALFHGPVGQALDLVIGTTQAGKRRSFGQPIRIELRMSLDRPAEARLHDLPWELLFGTPSPKFLVQTEQFSVVRYILVPLPGVRAPARPPLRILLVSASVPAAPGLDLERERRVIESTWKLSGSARLRVLTRCSLEEFERELELDPHIIHFMGHGEFDAQTGQGCLLFPDRNGQTFRLGAETAALLLDNRRSLRLVVLNACETARAHPERPFEGLATRLVAAGVPAVVAMGEPIQDAAAIAFSRSLYQELARRRPLDLALCRARKTLAAYPSFESRAAWAVPKLFSRTREPLVEPPWRRYVKVVLLALALAAGASGLLAWKLWRHYDDVVSGARLVTHATLENGRVVEVCNPVEGWSRTAAEAMRDIERGDAQYFTKSRNLTTGRILLLVKDGELQLQTEADGITANNLSSLEPCPRPAPAAPVERALRGATAPRAALPDTGTPEAIQTGKLQLDPPPVPNQEKQ